MPEDMRQQDRFPVANAVFIELVSPEFGSNETGTIARCETVEISREGLRIRLGRELPVGAILQVAVELPDGARTLYLVCDIRWSRPVPDTGARPAWEAGLVLLNADDSDTDEWTALVTRMES